MQPGRSTFPAATTRVVLGCGLSALSGLLLALSFAPYDAWFLVWVAMAPMVVAQHRVLPAHLSGLAPALGVGGFMAGYVGGMFPPAAAWYMHALPLIVGAIVFVATRSERGRYERAGYALLPLRAAAIWVVIELARAFVPVLGTWGFFGYALYRQAWLLQPVRAVGIFGLDLLIVLVNYSLALGAVAWLDRRRVFDTLAPVSVRLATHWCGGALAGLTVWLALSVAWPAPVESSVRVAVLQPGHRPRDLASTPQARDRAILDVLAGQTRQAAALGAKLVVWPEAALAADPSTAYPAELAGLAQETGAYLVVGYGIRTPAGNRNEVVTVEPGGAFVGRYGKDHPVLFLGGTSISRGTYPTYPTPFGTMGAIICYDTDFTDSARELARRGAKIIAVPSADWAAIATKHYTHLVFRALETGAVMAKSEYSHDSAIVDPFGNIAASAITPEGSQAVLVADVPLRRGVPLVARLGDWVGWLCAGALLVQALGDLRRRAGRLMTARVQGAASAARCSRPPR